MVPDGYLSNDEGVDSTDPASSGKGKEETTEEQDIEQRKAMKEQIKVCGLCIYLSIYVSVYPGRILSHHHHLLRLRFVL